jgi:very-short-patch-repair endonuclease
MTSSEALLWVHLRKQRRTHRFRRQHPIGPFRVDFYCPELRLVIEVDGPIHAQRRRQDHERQRWLEQQGFQVLRFSNDDILHRLAQTLSSLDEFLHSAAPQSNQPADCPQPAI